MHHLSKEDAVAISTAFSGFKVIVPLQDLKSQCQDNPMLVELFDNLLDSALRYAESVCRFQQIVDKNYESVDPIGDRQAIEDVRGSIHEGFNDLVNILSRTMARNGKDASWRSKIGENRATLGRFALTLSFEYVKSEIEGGAL